MAQIVFEKDGFSSHPAALLTRWLWSPPFLGCVAEGHFWWLHLPSNPPQPTLDVAGGSNQIILQSQLFIAPIASVSEPMHTDQLALCPFNPIAPMQALTKWFGFHF